MLSSSTPSVAKDMKIRTMLLILALAFIAVAATFASESNLGVWKLREAKSRFSATAAKNRTVVYEAEGNNMKVTVDATDARGQSTHSTWTGKFDGKDYPVIGDPASTARSCKKIDDHTTEFTERKDGKITIRGRVVVTADGKSLTVTGTGTDANGRKVKYTAVYDKE